MLHAKPLKLFTSALVTIAAVSSDLAAQLEPPSNGGAVKLDLILQSLAEPRRLLIIAAHPDDEDTELLALASRGYGAEAAYLALTRGDGGQNLIGTELGPALGVLRTEELMAARQVDGARQFFTRAYDFGYSRSADEVSRFWPPDSILKDVVRVVRQVRPHVIVSIFSGTERDGHGQHQYAGIMARRAFEVSGSDSVYAELLTEEGLEPWSPVKLYQSTRFWPDETTLELQSGRLDPRTGRSFHQIAMASRSKHRSQDMGRLQDIGPSVTKLKFLASRNPLAADDSNEEDIFSGIPPGRDWLGNLVDSLRKEISVADAGRAVPALVEAADRIAVDDRRRAQIEEALGAAAGLVVDAVAARGELVPGERVEVTLELYNGGDYEVELESFDLTVPQGWEVSGGLSTVRSLPPRTSVTTRVTVTVPGATAPTQPYYVKDPLEGALYSWEGADPEVRGLPRQDPLLELRVELRLLGTRFSLGREVTYRYNDQASGEVREPLRVVPRVEVKLEPEILVWPSDGQEGRSFTVQLTHNGRRPVRGAVWVEAEGWPQPARQAFSFRDPTEAQVFEFQLVRPEGVDSARLRVRARARAEDGETFGQHVVEVSYPHIRSANLVKDAEGMVVVAPLEIPRGSVGYVRGAADRVPEALRQIGVPVSVITEDQLAQGDLSDYDVIVVGPRAYEVNETLTRFNDRLLEYVRAGGRMVVQYQQYQFERGGYAPYPIDIAVPHDRVTDELSPVTVIDSDHPAVNHPNRIQAADWEGWPQERGLYFAHEWDPAYQSVLEMGDREMPKLRGGLLIAGYGEGVYVYTGLAFFRSLPAGVPGAFRLFLNLLALDPNESI